MEPKNIFIALVIFVIIITGYIVIDSDNVDDQALLNEQPVVLNKEANNTNHQIDPPNLKIEEGESAYEMMDSTEENTKLEIKTESTNEPGKYLTYSADAVSESNADNIILFFHATWCPSCRTLDKDINKNFSDLPPGTEIYKVDYDTNVSLRKQYKVTTQHTLVVVNSDGSLVKKWNGGNTLNSIISKI